MKRVPNISWVVRVLLCLIMSFVAIETQAREPNLALPTGTLVPDGTPVKQTDSAASSEKTDETNFRFKRQSGFALSLAGGGARGAAHIGVLKVLDAEGLRPDFISGSSMGALIGGLYAAGVPIAEIEKIALSGELEKAYFPRNRRLQAATWGISYLGARALMIHPRIGLYSGRSVSRLISKHLPPGITQLEDMPLPFAAAAVDLTTTKSVWLNKGSIAESIRASNSVPGFFRPVEIGEHVLVDGGVRSNLPTEIAQAQGAPIVVAVRLQAYLDKVEPKKYDTVMNYGDRIASIFLAEIENKAVDKSDILIEPKMSWMKLTSFKHDELKAAIEAGEVAARKVLPKLREYQSQNRVGAFSAPTVPN